MDRPRSAGSMVQQHFSYSAMPLSSFMAQKGYHMFAYIDDYILVNETEEQAFDSLVNLLNELGVPINPDKLSPL